MNHKRVSKIPLFSDIPRRRHHAIAALVDEIELAPGRTLMREGDSAREVFVIVDGSADVKQGSTTIGVVGRGHVVGEIGVIERRPRTATVVARSAPMHLLVIAPRELASLMARFPSIDRKLRAAVTARSAATAAVAEVALA